MEARRRRLEHERLVRLDLRVRPARIRVPGDDEHVVRERASEDEPGRVRLGPGRVGPFDDEPGRLSRGRAGGHQPSEMTQEVVWTMTQEGLTSMLAEPGGTVRSPVIRSVPCSEAAPSTVAVPWTPLSPWGVSSLLASVRLGVVENRPRRARAGDIFSQRRCMSLAWTGGPLTRRRGIAEIVDRIAEEMDRVVAILVSVRRAR